MLPNEAVLTEDLALSDDELLDKFQCAAFGYFLQNTNTENGLVADRSRGGSPSSIAVTGFALSSYPVGCERGWICREQALKRTLTTLRFLWSLPQGSQSGASGYLGFFFHFLDMETGERALDSELSVIDTALLMAGVLSCGSYWTGETAAEQEIRSLSDALYRRVNWASAKASGATILNGWEPLGGYNEALIMGILSLGSPEYSISPDVYSQWTTSFQLKKLFGYEMVYAGPLFIHQFSHAWLDLEGIQDDFMRRHNSDYFANTHKATHVHREYSLQNPHGFAGYDGDLWGLSACDGPGELKLTVGDREQNFLGYAARGAPFGPDDGTIAPWSCLASLPFAPEISIRALRHLIAKYPDVIKDSMIVSAVNPSLANTLEFGAQGWVSEGHFGLDQGIVVLMIENHRSQLIWHLMRSCSYIRNGLQKAGFSGGWLSD